MMDSGPGIEYEGRLLGILERHDWEALRDFSRDQNEVPADVYDQPQHFWEVMLHKLICNRLELLSTHEESRKWLAERGYTTDLGGY